jgi:hypothetical protein
MSYAQLSTIDQRKSDNDKHIIVDGFMSLGMLSQAKEVNKYYSYTSKQQYVNELTRAAIAKNRGDVLDDLEMSGLIYPSRRAS